MLHNKLETEINMLSPSSLLLSSTKVTRFSFVMLMVLLVHACGFQLRGSLTVSNEMAPVYLQQNSVFELAREVKRLFTTNKIETVDNAVAAKTQLTLLSESKNTRVLSVDGSGQAQEYLLTYTANITIKTETGKAVSDSVVVRRDLVFDSTAVLGFANEADVLYKDMRKQAARLILLKLQAYAANDVAGSNNSSAAEDSKAEQSNSESSEKSPNK